MQNIRHKADISKIVNKNINFYKKSFYKIYKYLLNIFFFLIGNEYFFYKIRKNFIINFLPKEFKKIFL